MPYPLNYRRPRYTAPQLRYSTSSYEGSSSDGPFGLVESSTARKTFSHGIPEDLTFDKIMSDSTRPPCTSRDFMDFLMYIEHSAENLQFYLWFQSYEKRFKEAGSADVALAPEWTKDLQDAALQAVLVERNANKATTKLLRHQPVEISEIFRASFSKGLPVVVPQNPFECSPNPSDAKGLPRSSSFANDEKERHVSTETYSRVAKDAFEAVGLKQPFTIQPFRQEVHRIIATYITEGSPRQLNITWKERIVILKALSYTTHPSAFRAVFKTTDLLLRRQSHPNFVRWATSNGNPPRVIFGIALGVFLVISSLLAAVLITLSSANRGFRAIPAIGFILGWCVVICAWKGICVVLLGMHARHVRPWELYEGFDDTVEMKKSLESGEGPVSYEAFPWENKYDRRSVLRKVLERQVWIQDPALRCIQDTIFWQSVVVSVMISVVITCVFLVVPHGHLL